MYSNQGGDLPVSNTAVYGRPYKHFVQTSTRGILCSFRLNYQLYPYFLESGIAGKVTPCLEMFNPFPFIFTTRVCDHYSNGFGVLLTESNFFMLKLLADDWYSYRGFDIEFQCVLDFSG